MKKIVLGFSGLLFLIACNNKRDNVKTEEQATVEETTDKRAVNPYVASIEEAHNKNKFLKEEVVSFNLNLSFGGKERINGKLTLATNSSKGRLDYTNGKTILYNQDGIYYSNNFESTQGIGFDAYTWSYFFLFPYKLSDPGTKWADYTATDSLSKSHNTKKLLFEAGTGEAPDDWYITYANKGNNRVDYAAYIVTANKSQEEAEVDPHGIRYINYKEINGIPIAHSWTFWAWRDGLGFTKQLGEAELTNVEFRKEEEKEFIPSTDFIKL